MAHVRLKKKSSDLVLYSGYSGQNVFTLNPPGYTYYNGTTVYSRIVYPTLQSDHINADTANDCCAINLRTIDKIDISKYGYIEVEMMSVNFEVNRRYISMGFTVIESGQLQIGANYYELFWQDVSYNNKQVYKIDISSVPANWYYLVWGSVGGINRGGNLYKIKLIHK